MIQFDNSLKTWTFKKVEIKVEGKMLQLLKYQLYKGISIAIGHWAP